MVVKIIIIFCKAWSGVRIDDQGALGKLLGDGSVLSVDLGDGYIGSCVLELAGTRVLIIKFSESLQAD